MNVKCQYKYRHKCLCKLSIKEVTLLKIIKQFNNKLYFKNILKIQNFLKKDVNLHKSDLL